MKLIKSLIIVLGDFSLFIFDSVQALRFFWKRRGLFLRQCEFIGVSSIGINIAAALFLGAVLGYQLYVSLHRFGAEALLGGTVGVALFRELAPVMAGIMVTGRAGAAMAAEISSMQVSEQIDALEVMAVDPIEFLVTPRIMAGVLMMPFLALLFSMVASVAAYGIACGEMGLQSTIFWSQYWKYVDLYELLHCTVKSAVFGFVFTSMGCFFGIRAFGGARAVGNATRSTVVASSLSILLSDYFLTSLLPFGFRTLQIM